MTSDPNFLAFERMIRELTLEAGVGLCRWWSTNRNDPPTRLDSSEFVLAVASPLTTLAAEHGASGSTRRQLDAAARELGFTVAVGLFSQQH